MKKNPICYWFDPPFQVDPGCPSVVNGLDAIEHNSPLCGHDGHEQVERGRAETIAHQKGAQKAKPKNHNHVHILELCKDKQILLHYFTFSNFPVELISAHQEKLQPPPPSSTLHTQVKFNITPKNYISKTEPTLCTHQGRSC